MDLYKPKQRRFLYISIILVCLFIIKLVKTVGLAADITSILVLPLMAGLAGILVYLVTIFLHHFFTKSSPKLSLALDTLFGVLVFLIFLNTNLSFSLHNNEINSTLLTKINSLDEKLYKSLLENQPSVMFDMFTEEVKASGPKSVESVYSAMKGKIPSAKLELYDQYLVTTDSGANVMFFSENKEKFQITVPRRGKKTFISLKRIPGDFADLLLSNVYVEEKGEWRLFISHVGEVAINKKSTYQWIEEAEKHYKEKSYVMSLMDLDVAKKISPAPFITYKNKEKIDALIAKNMNEMKSIQWPISVDFIKTRPQIIAIKSQFLSGVLYPRFYYITKIPFTETQQLQDEAERMKEYLLSIFNGIDKDKQYLLFQAYNEMPSDEKKSYQSYGVVVDLKRKDVKN